MRSATDGQPHDAGPENRQPFPSLRRAAIDGWARNSRDGRVFHVARQGEAFHALSRRFATTSDFVNPLPVSRDIYTHFISLLDGHFKTFWTVPGTFPSTSGSRILLPVQHPRPEMECQQVRFTSASDYILPVPLGSIFTPFRSYRVQNGG